MKKFLADVPKMAVMPHTTGDVLTLLEATAEVKALYPSDPNPSRWPWDHWGLLHVQQVHYLVNAMTFASAGKSLGTGSNRCA